MRLELEGVEAGYDQAAVLQGVSLRVEAGGCACLLGANGAGKTTTMRTIAGLLRPGAGRIALDGQPIGGWSPDRILAAGLAMVPEGRRVFAGMSVAENIEMGGYLQPRGALRGAADRVYALFPRLAERRAQGAGTLSGGEQQMLAIGRALMGRPRTLLLDEPSMGLAPLIVRAIFEAVRALNADGLTVLIAEQNARAVLGVAQAGFVLAEGRVVAADAAANLLSSPAIQEAYLGL